jgi:hypothetical protein
VSGFYVNELLITTIVNERELLERLAASVGITGSYLEGGKSLVNGVRED